MAIVNYIKTNNGILAVNAGAGAGCGKTSTAQLIVAELKPKKGFYTAFNSAIVSETSLKFPSSIECKTQHAFALKYVKQMISSGAKKDMLVLQFCKAMLDVSKMEETVNDTDVVSVKNNKNYHLNKRIQTALDKMSDRMQTTLNTLYIDGGTSTAEWVRSNMNKRIGSTIKDFQAKTVNLEMLSMWIMYVNFCERDKAIHPLFKEWLDEKQYFRIIELLGGTEVARLEGEMFDISYDIVKRIKG